MHTLFRNTFLIVAIIATSSLGANADPLPSSNRTWVSGVGDDSGVCARAAPCKTLAVALTKTAAGGEIVVLDSGDFGNVIINKSITIVSDGVQAGILANGLNAITVNAGASDVVHLRGLHLNGAGDPAGTTGISFVAGAALHVEQSLIHGFSGKGLDFAPIGNAELYVDNTSFRNNTAGAIHVHAGASGSVRGMITNVQMVDNGFGIRVEDASVILARNCVASGSVNAGFNAVSSLRPTVLTLEAVASTTNQTGVRASGAGATLRLNYVTVIANSGVGLSTAGGGSIISFRNNHVSGNTGGNGAPTSVEASM